MGPMLAHKPCYQGYFYHHQFNILSVYPSIGGQSQDVEGALQAPVPGFSCLHGANKAPTRDQQDTSNVI